MRRNIPGLVTAAALAFFSLGGTAAADELDTIHLKNGGHIRGMVFLQDPRKGVSIKLPNGTTKTVPAADVERVVYRDSGGEEPGSGSAAPPRAESRPKAPPAASRAKASPAGSTPKAPADESPSRAGDPHGPFFVNLKVGPQLILGAGGMATFALEPQIGYAVVPRAYITFSPQFAFGGATFITLPLGFEYDFRPLPGLSIYPHVALGVAFATGGGGAAFAILPEVGAKYQFTSRFHAGAELFSMPIYVGGATFVSYRALVYGGVDF